ncbi:uncharacterized protein LOC128278892 [Anopheles cruzii]|uniref:uncharacterized protein LOC128278892 n=1 Tax=Anopheles cruzii TaxID=68878 RepID=UPI0022EC3949|nr:uncharacterized protein LOC128278892 [Anopheles cruzii]
MRSIAPVLLLVVASLGASQLDRQPVYRKYLRTQKPARPGELHVEEVLEVFRTGSRPSRYGVSSPLVNRFLATDRLRSLDRSSSTSAAPAETERPTYRTPVYENRNPNYTYLFQPSITVTKYRPVGDRPSLTGSVIVIQEADPLVSPVTVKPPDDGVYLDYDDDDQSERDQPEDRRTSPPMT